MKRVVITGLGVLAPNGTGLKEFTQALQASRSGIRFIERLKELQFGCQIGGIVQGISEITNQLFSEEQQHSINDVIRLAAIAGLECWKDGQMPSPHPDTLFEDTGAIIGLGLGGVDTIAETLVPSINAGKVRRMGSTLVEKVMASGASAFLGGLLGLGGQVTTNSSACTTGTEAVAEAYFKIKEGRVKQMLAGGAEGSSPYIWGGFDAMRVLSKGNNERPDKGSRPLSATSSGFVPGSGAGILLLEELDTALARGARIYAEVLGAEVNCGGQRNGGSMTAPSSKGVIRCIKTALSRAKISAGEIDLINAHLTGTFADPHEVSNWQQALQLPPENFPYIQATKSMIGHALGAAGGIELVACVLQLYYGFIHGSLNCEDLHPDLQAYRNKILEKTQLAPLQVIAKASFGFGDVNGCVILKRWKQN
jgi:3-oxoacyl-(acyl-carrier-protein) synthase